MNPIWTFVGDAHITDLHGNHINIWVNQTGYYNIVHDADDNHFILLLNQHIFIKYLKNGYGIVGDWIDGTFIQFGGVKNKISSEENNHDNDAIIKKETKNKTIVTYHHYFLSYTTKNPDHFVMDGNIIKIGEKYYFHHHDNNNNTKIIMELKKGKNTKKEKEIFYFVFNLKHWNIVVTHVKETYQKSNETIVYQNLVVKIKGIFTDNYQTMHDILGQTILKKNNLASHPQKIIDDIVDDYQISGTFQNDFTKIENYIKII